MNPGAWLAAIGVLGMALFSQRAGQSAEQPAGQSRAPRGIRNNNPGNLVITPDNWRGKIPVSENTDGRFEQFAAPEWGIRAMFIDIRGDIEQDGLNTVRKLITEYAPDHENNTAAYIASVSQQIGQGPDELILPGRYQLLIKSIIRHENGEQPYSDDLINRAMAMA